MQNSHYFAEVLGKLVKHTRATTMDQTELATRVGVGRNTISAIENGKPVNSQALFDVLDHLGLLEPMINMAENQLATLSGRHLRKQRKPQQELSNDF